MTYRDALLLAILLDPPEDVPRGAFADCIQEDGDDDFAAFIRAGITAAKYRHETVIDAQEYYDALRDINRVCEAGHPAEWIADIGVVSAAIETGNWGWSNTLDRVAVRIGKALGVYIRGMLSELTVTLGEWSAIAERALTRRPIERVNMSDVPGLSLTTHPRTSVNADW